MQMAEIELKFSVEDVEALRRQLSYFGFTLQTPRTFEHNTLYDTPDRSLREMKQLLRIRRYGNVYTLTHKRPSQPHEEPDPRFKLRYETETVIDDSEAMGVILEQLGYSPAFVYEKYREEWLDSATGNHLVIDETPIGTWAELEGHPDWIDRNLSALCITPDQCTTSSYGRIFLDWKVRTGSPAEHFTFEALQTISVR